MLTPVSDTPGAGVVGTGGARRTPLAAVAEREKEWLKSSWVAPKGAFGGKGDALCMPSIMRKPSVTSVEGARPSRGIFGGDSREPRSAMSGENPQT